MSFLAPWAALLAGALVVPPLVLLYFLKRRREPVTVSSTLLWRKAIDDMQVNAPFQRLRRNLLLLLQLLLMFALLLALARPTVQGATDVGERVIILIDHSASMNATDVPGGRLAEARRLALEVVESMDIRGGVDVVAADAGAAAGAMVISFAEQAGVRQPFTTDRTRLRDAIRGIEPTDGGTNIAHALRLIEPFTLAGQQQAAGLHVYILSDGRWSSNVDVAMPNTRVTFLSIGATADDPNRRANVGIVALAARHDFNDPEQVQVFARLTNDGPRPIDTNLTVRLDGRTERVVPVQLPPATASEPGSTQATFAMTVPDTGLIELFHDYDDPLIADNRVATVVGAPRRLRVLLVSEGNTWVSLALEAVGAGEVVTLSPSNYESQPPGVYRRGGGSGEGFDVIIFDRHSPVHLPRVNSMYLDAAPPVPGLALIPRGGDGGSRVILNWQRQHPLLRFVQLDDLVLRGTGRLMLPERAQSLAVGRSGPVMAHVIHEQRHHVVVAFDVLETNWPRQPGFPVFFANAVPWLAMGGRAEEALSYRPGQVAVVPAAEAGGRVRYDGPVTLTAEAVAGQAVLPIFQRTGVYRHSSRSSLVDPVYEHLAVNLVNPAESDLRPAESVSLGSATLAAARESAVRREAWRWFAWGALALLAVEWVVYTRRMHL